MAADLATTVEEQVRRMSPVAAADEEREEFAALFRMLEEVRKPGEAAFKLVGPDGRATELPVSALYLLVRLVEVLARGDAITLVPVHKELTTQQAADILNVSRQYLVRLLDEGKIPFSRTGTHRKVRFEDLIKYKRQRDQKRLETLDELTRLSQQYGGYDELP